MLLLDLAHQLVIARVDTRRREQLLHLLRQVKATEEGEEVRGAILVAVADGCHLHAVADVDDYASLAMGGGEDAFGAAHDAQARHVERVVHPLLQQLHALRVRIGELRQHELVLAGHDRQLTEGAIEDPRQSVPVDGNPALCAGCAGAVRRPFLPPSEAAADNPPALHLHDSSGQILPAKADPQVRAAAVHHDHFIRLDPPAPAVRHAVPPLPRRKRRAQVAVLHLDAQLLGEVAGVDGSRACVRRAVALGGPYPARPIPHALAPHAHDRVVDVQPERVRRCANLLHLRRVVLLEAALHAAVREVRELLGLADTLVVRHQLPRVELLHALVDPATDLLLLVEVGLGVGVQQRREEAHPVDPGQLGAGVEAHGRLRRDELEGARLAQLGVRVQRALLNLHRADRRPVAARNHLFNLLLGLLVAGFCEREHRPHLALFRALGLSQLSRIDFPPPLPQPPRARLRMGRLERLQPDVALHRQQLSVGDDQLLLLRQLPQVVDVLDELQFLAPRFHARPADRVVRRLHPRLLRRDSALQHEVDQSLAHVPAVQTHRPKPLLLFLLLLPRAHADAFHPQE